MENIFPPNGESSWSENTCDDIFDLLNAESELFAKVLSKTTIGTVDCFRISLIGGDDSRNMGALINELADLTKTQMPTLEDNKTFIFNFDFNDFVSVFYIYSNFQNNIFIF